MSLFSEVGRAQWSFKSPLRVDLAGGTLDLWPIWAFLGSAKTYNLAINLFASAQLSFREDLQVFVSLDEHLFQFASAQDFLAEKDQRLSLAQVAYRFIFWEGNGTQRMLLPFGFNLELRSDSPKGAGLGGSSALLCSLLQVFFDLASHLGLTTPLPIFDGAPLSRSALVKGIAVDNWVHWAHHLEAQVLQTPTGVQDYVPALMRGLCEINLSPRGLKLMHAPRQEFWCDFIGQRSFLVYTGAPHHSGINNFEVLSRLVRGDSNTRAAVLELAGLSERLGQILSDKKDFEGASFFREELDARLRLSPVFSSPEIEKILSIFSQDCDVGVKICGAGGGGCVMIWVNEPSKKTESEEICRKLGFQVFPATPLPPA